MAAPLLITGQREPLRCPDRFTHWTTLNGADFKFSPGLDALVG